MLQVRESAVTVIGRMIETSTAERAASIEARDELAVTWAYSRIVALRQALDILAEFSA